MRKKTKWILFFLCLTLAAALVFAALGFVSYHGMTAEKLLWAWLRSELLEARQYACKPQNLYYELMKDSLSNKQKEARKRHAEKRKENDSSE